ncbi:DUF7848 domain-containing protein [Streptomyces varsoviensis]|uniref:DUF7848 domain-containing protein n=1 Tax=Streptomyces varsoviensis TaxID=67373 RepID=UPI00056ABB60|nr:hypothetical protein [Streptomyces varsoviensis]
MGRVTRDGHVAWTFEQDLSVRPEYSATCLVGEGEDCGEVIRSVGVEWIEEWMRRHTRTTGHVSYRRAVDDYVTLEPAATRSET